MPTVALDGPTLLVVLATAFAVVGVSHVRLHWRGREHVWFGLASLAAGVVTLLCARSDGWPRLVPYALAPPVFAGSQALGRRVRRQHREQVDLRHDLEARSRELAEANEAQGRFLANMSHEVRTPLNGILGVNRMLLQTLTDARPRELAEIVQSQGRALLAIINDLLDYSKIEAGRFELEPADFGLRRVIQEAARGYREQARAKGLEFVLDVEAAIPARVHGDAVRLRQVLDNLLANAVKFTERGSVRLRVRREGESVRFEVEDTGIGVDTATLAGLFRPFTQADSSTTRRYGGTGLGLAIAKSIVELMGGTIGGTGERGRGTTFWAVVPLPPPRQPAGPATPLEPWTPVRGIAPVRPAGSALLAEDNAINRMVTVGLLREFGWTVDVAATGTEAVAAFLGRAYDLVLMDCRMPELDGYGAAEQMRRHESTQGGRRRTPIVALTAHAVAGEAERCRAAGMDDYLTKPVSATLLARVLDQWKPAGAPPSPTIDTETLDDLGRRSPALLRQRLEHYLAQVPAEVAELRAAASKGDLEGLSAKAHDLVGSALLVGAKELARLLRAVESLDPAGGVTVHEAVTRAEQEHQRVHAALAARLAASPTPPSA